MSKDPTQSRIPRIGSTTSSRIPVPGSIRPLQARFHQSKLAKPSSIPPPTTPFATPATPAPNGFLRPLRSAAVSIARSYSGDTLCGELSPLPALAASTPAPALKPTSGLEFYRKLELASTENLHDTFAVASSPLSSLSKRGPAAVDYNDDGLMLVDESLELVRADSTDNILLTELQNGSINMLKPASSNETVTLNCDGNVTYEVKRSETFVKLSQESLKLGGSRESLNRTRGASLFQSSSKSSGESPIFDKTHSVLIDLGDGKGAFCSTMVSDRPMNVTQNIPNITAEMEALPHIKRQSLLYHTNEVLSPDRLLSAESMTPQRPTRLTFNLNETTNLLHISDPVAILNKTQVFSSTMHSPLAVGSIEDVLNVTRDIQGSSLVAAMHLGVPLDVSAGDRTLTAEDFEGGRLKLGETMNMDDGGAVRDIFDLSLDEPPSVGREEVPIRPIEGRTSIPARQRFSFGLDLTECTLDCSIELCDSSLSSTKPHIKSPVSTSLTKQGSFEMDESLGILTPDQMKEFLDSTTTNTNNTNNLELQLNTGSHKHGLHHCRIDQTPSPEELPLDPVGVKTDMSDIILPSEILSNAGPIMYQEISQTDSDSKTDQMTKSATSKVSNSFITSITSITSLDTGYQGDGEMSRPASRGADHSPSNGPKIKNQAAGVWNVPAAQPAPVPRRPDPMTDSDFFTESDADDVFNRGDRRAQIIDGQLYGPMLQGANVFINQQPQNEDSCMESSGIFTDVENRGEDDLVHRRSENEDQVDRDEAENSMNGVGQLVGDSDMSPDVSTDTISSSNTACSQKKVIPANAGKIEGGANCLQCASMDPSANANASSPAQVVEKSFDGPTPPESDVTKHVVTPSISGGAANTTATSQIQPSPSVTSLVSDVDSRNDSENIAVGIGASNKAESATNITIVRAGPNASSSTDSLSGAPVGSGGISSNNGCGKKPGSSRKQQKNETNLVLKKHEMSSRAVKSRLFKESPVSKASRSVGGSALNLDIEHECENQENKRPTSANRGGCGGGPRASGSVGNLSFTKKSATPNKWDAVMSKIAENKAVIKKNFSDVKSKISCGKTVVSTSSSSLVAGRRLDSPASLKSPPSECSSVGNRSIGAIPMTGAGGKRTISGSVKRRTHSKDSQQSSQSDLSLTGGSPKLQPKVSSIRPAKKRDVRTINSSSSDLGPPSKTVGSNVNPVGPQQQSQHQRASLRVSAPLQKRISSPANVTNASIVPEQRKGSPPPKRNLIAKRTLSAISAGSKNNTTTATINTSTTAVHVVKTPLKDHNRLVGPTPNAKQQSGTNSPKSQTKTLIRSLPAVAPPTTTTTTPSCPKNNNNNNNSITSNGTSLKNAANIQRNGTIILEKTSSPLILGGDARCTGLAPAVVSGGQQPKQKIGNETTLAPVVVVGGGGGGNNVESLRNNNLVDISLLNHANRGVEALGVLVQYLVFNLDAFSCPNIKKSHQKTTHDLLETKSMLNEERSTCQSLKQQLLENTEREAELQELHRCELSKVEACLSEQQRSAADRTTALQAELLRKELEADDKLRSATEQYESRLAEREAELKQSHMREQDLLQRINALSCTENELREKVHSSELDYSERLQAAALRERDLTEQLKHLNRQMAEVRRTTDARQQELEEKVSLTQDECNVLRHHGRASLEPSSPQEDRETSRYSLRGGSTVAAELSFTGVPLQTNRSSGNLSPAQVLQDEVNSLRCVLDLKQREISDLRKLTQEYERDAKDLPGALVKISALESRIEDLQVQLKTKTEEEKDLQQKLKLLQDNLKQETKSKSRLSQHNEELQWKLKQNSEKFSHVYAELSKSYHENSSFMNATRLSLDQTATSTIAHYQLNHSRSSGGSERVFEMDDLSPPTSPVIKGVVEKSDSVSWVLEMDDEPPEITASRMVRRAGSFRSSIGTGSQDVKRQRCFNNPINGIQQSSSVGSILKQQDVSPAKTMGGPPGTPRLRSKSVSIKAATEPPKKIVRSNSGASSSAVSKPIRMAEMPLSWKEPPLYSSSPYAHKRFLNERLENGGASKSFREGKDLFLEETEFLGDMGGESPFSRSRVGSFGEVSAEGASEQPAEFFHRDKTPNFKKSKENRGLITCDTTALTESGGDTPALKKRREFARKNLAGKSSSLPKEAAGEALVSGSNSDDEASSSSCLSDDLSSGGSSTSSSSNSSSGSSSTGGASSPSRSSGDGREALVELEESEQVCGAASGSGGDRRRRRSSTISIEDALMQKIVASLNGTIANEGNETPMEVSWSEDGDPTESIV
ncbi:serine-rich adhesin for platelets isoform X2 [Ochlerotatus camptorhynchus]|uniref:serine-rich adhesin for platelets isoform X2 n=1 Tax=Ochlerotatus camptorhynchus TaxID=644619 RepID=UPI0031DED0E0